MITVPIVASETAVPSTGRICGQPAVSPPSKRISTRPIVPRVRVSSASVELDPADALGADQHPEAEEEQQAGHPDAVGDLGRREPDGEQEPGDEDQLGVGHRGDRTRFSAGLVGQRELGLDLLAGLSPRRRRRARGRARRRATNSAAAAARKPTSIRRAGSSTASTLQTRKPSAQAIQQVAARRACPRASAAWLSVVEAR